MKSQLTKPVQLIRQYNQTDWLLPFFVHRRTMVDEWLGMTPKLRSHSPAPVGSIFLFGFAFGGHLLTDEDLSQRWSDDGNACS